MVTYWPVLVQPFLSDDYVQLGLGRRYGAMSSWGALLNDALYRCRATSILLTHWTESLFGISPLPYYMTSMALHVVNSLLVFLVGWRLGLGKTRSYLAAVVFAIGIRHQEAVMWYAALPELLLFFFCGCFLLAWNAWVTKRQFVFYALAVVCFVLALGSKEPAVVLAPIAVVLSYRAKRGVADAAPLVLMAGIYAYLNAAAKADHLHWNDGTFSLSAPFLLTWARSLGKMYWFWGVLGIAALAAWKRSEWRTVRWAALWCGVALLPYSFLLYMPVVPSRHMYLAGAGVAFAGAAGLLAARKRFPERQWVLPAVLAAMFVFNMAYLWGKKREQFLERTAATEDLLELVRRTDGLIYVTCFPYGPDAAEQAIEIVLQRRATMLVWNATPPPGAVTYCAKHP